MKKFLYSFVCVTALGSSFPGGGYSTRSNLAGHIKLIYVQPFKNSIAYTTESRRSLYLPLLEVKAKNAVVDRFQFDGNLKIATEDKADLILKGELKDYQRSGLRYTDNNDVQEYRVQIFVSLELWDVKKQAVVWQEPNFVGEATYFTTGSLAKSEDAAVEEATSDLAKRIVERTVEDW